MRYIKKGSVLDSDSFIITEQERKLISVIFSYFQDNVADDILANFENVGGSQ